MDFYLALSLESRTQDKIGERDRPIFTSPYVGLSQDRTGSAEAREGPVVGSLFSSASARGPQSPGCLSDPGIIQVCGFNEGLLGHRSRNPLTLTQVKRANKSIKGDCEGHRDGKHRRA